MGGRMSCPGSGDGRRGLRRIASCPATDRSWIADSGGTSACAWCRHRHAQPSGSLQQPLSHGSVAASRSACAAWAAPVSCRAPPCPEAPACACGCAWVAASAATVTASPGVDPRCIATEADAPPMPLSTRHTSSTIWQRRRSIARVYHRAPRRRHERMPPSHPRAAISRSARSNTSTGWPPETRCLRSMITAGTPLMPLRRKNCSASRTSAA